MTKQYQQIIKKVNWFLFLLVAFTLPFSPVILRIVWTTWIISWILEFRFLDRRNFSLSKYQIPSFIFFTYFICQCISYFWTIDKFTGSLILERQISFFILPFILLFGVNNNYNIKKAIFSFIIGSAFISAFYICCIFILSNYSIIIESEYSNILDNLQFNTFFKDFRFYFNHIRHHAFFSEILIIASIFLFFSYNDLKQHIGKWSALLLTALYTTTNLFFFIYLANSRGSIVTIFGITILGILIFLVKKKSWPLYFLNLCLLILFIVLFAFYPKKNNPKWEKLTNIEQITNNDTRLKILSTSLKHSNEFILTGKGVGSSKMFLEQKNREDHILDNEFINKKFHPHNQYIETTLDLGIFGLLLFISGFILQLVISKKNIKIIGLYIFVCFAIKCFFDCMFRSDDVIIQLCFILLLFYWLNTAQEKKI